MKNKFNAAINKILKKHEISSMDEIEVGTEVYEDLYDLFMEYNELPYGIAKARTGDPDQFIVNYIEREGISNG